MPACDLGVKLAGVHWWFKSRAHAAELTAGYYNTRDRDGYIDVMQVLARHNARVSFTCVEMRDCEHPPEGRCSPQGTHPPSPLNVHYNRVHAPATLASTVRVSSQQQQGGGASDLPACN